MDAPPPVTMLEPLRPSAEAVATMQRRARWVAPLVRTLLRPLLRIDVTGREHVPREGPALVLTNHVSELDPILIALAADRPIQWMGSEALFEDSLRARLIVPWGLVPKKKFTADTRAVRELVRWAKAGGCTGLFPEGQRPWDGRPLPLLPGIERLVLAMKAPLVTGRLLNADHHWPRWAVVPRAGVVRVDFDPPVDPATLGGPEAVLAYLEDKLRAPPATSPHWPVRGVGLARGLANLLFACPACGVVEALRERGSSLACTACGERWRVTTTHLLVPAGGGPPLPILAASDGIRARFAAAGMRDPALAGTDVVLESEPALLLDRTDPRGVVVGEGVLRLTPTTVALAPSPGAAPTWSLPLAELSSVSAEQRRRLWLRARDRLYEPILPRESVCKWEWVLEHWRRVASPG